MTEYYGNAIPSPGFVETGTTVDDELLFSTVGYTQKGVTLEPGQGVLFLGTLIKRNSATKKYVKATSAADAEGVLRQTTDTGSDSSAQGWQGNIVLTGLLKLSKVTSANSGITLTDIPGVRVNEVIDSFKF